MAKKKKVNAKEALERLRAAKKRSSAKKAAKSKPAAKVAAVSPSQREFDFDEDIDVEEQAKEIGKNIKAVARAFRLRWQDVSKSRKLPDAHRRRVAETVDCDASQLRLTTLLYAQHPAIKELAAAKTAVKELWQSFTLPYPSESGVRLFPVRSDTEEERQQEVREFLEHMHDKIGDFRAAVTNLAEQWPDVLEASRESLRGVYQPENYPAADELHHHIRCVFEPFNFELPDYLKHVSPKEYAKQADLLNRKFEEVVHKQSQLIEEAMASSLNQMVASVQGWADGKKKSFKTSVVENVFKSLEEFKRNTERFGILDGTPLAKQFDGLHKLLLGVGDDSQDISTRLRKNEDQRESFMEKASELRDSILAMSSERTRRKILRAAPEDEPKSEPAPMPDADAA